jgi:hypothetical protein
MWEYCNEFCDTDYPKPHLTSVFGEVKVWGKEFNEAP